MTTWLLTNGIGRIAVIGVFELDFKLIGCSTQKAKQGNVIVIRNLPPLQPKPLRCIDCIPMQG